MGSEVAAGHRYFLGLLRLIPTRLVGAIAWLLASKQVRQLARGAFVDELMREVIQRLYCTDIASGDANTRRFINVRVVIGDEDRVVAESSARGLFFRLPPKFVTGTHGTVKEPTDHRDSRYRALTTDIADCLREEFSALCARCREGDMQAQALFNARWRRAQEYRLERAFRGAPVTAERREAFRAVTWRLAAADATLTPARAFDAAIMEVAYPREGDSPA
jgi:hypothetical protein